MDIVYALSSDGDKTIISDGNETFISWLSSDEKAVLSSKPSQAVGFCGPESEAAVTFDGETMRIYPPQGEPAEYPTKWCYISPSPKAEYVAIRTELGVKFVHYSDHVAGEGEEKSYTMPLNAYATPVISPGMSLAGFIDETSSKILTISPFNSGDAAVTVDLGKTGVVWSAQISGEDKSINLYVSSSTSRNVITKVSNVGGMLRKKTVVALDAVPVRVVTTPSGTVIAAVCNDGSVENIAQSQGSSHVCKLIREGHDFIRVFAGGTIMSAKQNPVSVGPVYATIISKTGITSVRLTDTLSDLNGLRCSRRTLVTADKVPMSTTLVYDKSNSKCVIIPVDDTSIIDYNPSVVPFVQAGFNVVTCALNRSRKDYPNRDMWLDDVGQDIDDVARVMRKTRGYATVVVIADNDYADACVSLSSMKNSIDAAILVDPTRNIGSIGDIVKKITKHGTLFALEKNSATTPEKTGITALDESTIYEGYSDLMDKTIGYLKTV